MEEIIINNNSNVPLGKQNGNKPDIQKIVMTMKSKDCVIFCRVSSFGQTGNFHISFEVQEEKGNACARLFHLRVKLVIKCVESAYSGTSSTIKKLINKFRGKNIIIYNVSRFCRNKASGVGLLEYALKCNTRLFFVDEGIIWDKNNQNNLSVLKRKLELAEEESRAIGKRVKDALAEKKRRGYFTGGVPKYGYKVIDVEGGRKAVPEEYEQAVIKFINMCREVGTSVKVLNEWVKQLSSANSDTINLEFSGKTVNRIHEPLSYNEIANLLNDFDIRRRGTNWSTSSVSKICKQDYENVLENLMEITTGFH